MGYCIRLVDYDFILAAAEKQAALLAIKAMPDIRYPWVNFDDVKRAKTLEEAMYVWNYRAEVDKGGNIIGVEFCADKMGNEELMFRAIAPFVKGGSYLEFTGEDDARWRWKFVNGVLKNLDAKIVWEE